MMPLGLKLMLIGMLTVFCVLLIIIYFSRVLILFVNKFIPETPEKSSKIPDDIYEAVSKAVFHITGGKGTVAGIQEL